MKSTNNTPQKWIIEKEQLHAGCKIFDVYKRKCKHPLSGKESDFFVIKTNDWVQAIGVTENKELILIQQYRFGTDSLSWEVPGGVIDKGESPVDAAVRELKEETGFIGKKNTLLAHNWPNPAILNNTVYFVLIEGCHPIGETAWDEHEELAIKTVPLSEVDTLIAKGTFNHSVTMNSLYYLRNHLENNSNLS